MTEMPDTVGIALKAPGNGSVLAGVPEQAGMAKLSNALLEQMRDLGVEVGIAGIVHTDRGFAFATKQAVFKCVESLERKIADEKADIHEIASSLAKCAKAIGLLSAKAEEAPPRDPKPPRKSFAAGQNAQFHLHIHKKETA